MRKSRRGYLSKQGTLSGGKSEWDKAYGGNVAGCLEDGVYRDMEEPSYGAGAKSAHHPGDMGFGRKLFHMPQLSYVEDRDYISVYHIITCECAHHIICAF